MIKWLHELFNPHCQHCADERREQREILREQNACSSCETLASENARLVRENERLLEILLMPKEIPAVKPVEELKPVKVGGGYIPIGVRRQMLENESRHAARLMREAPKPDTTQTDKLNPMNESDIANEMAKLDKELEDVRSTKN